MNHEEFLFLKATLLKKKSIKAKAISDSMEPCIMTGEEIEVIPLESYPKPFDIITFWDGEKVMCHFFWKLSNFEEKTYLTRSLKDTGSFDLPFKSQDILGIVVSHKISWLQKLMVYFKLLK